MKASFTNSLKDLTENILIYSNLFPFISNKNLILQSKPIYSSLLALYFSSNCNDCKKETLFLQTNIFMKRIPDKERNCKVT